MSQFQWDQQFLGEDYGKGVGVLSNRLDKSAATANELAMWLTQRSQLEQLYASEMMRISQAFPFKCEDQGVLKSVLDSANNTLKTVASLHQNYSLLLAQAAENAILPFVSDQRRIKQTCEAEIEKLQKIISKETLVAEKSRKDYCVKNTAMNQAILVAAKGQTSNMTKKDYEKVKEKAIKAKMESDQAEQEYRQAVTKINQLQEQQEQRVLELIRQAQQLETTRMELIKQTIVRLEQNHIEQICNVETLNWSRLFELINGANLINDLDDFCRLQKTGNAPLRRLEFIPATINNTDSASNTPYGSSGTLSRPPPKSSLANLSASARAESEPRLNANTAEDNKSLSNVPANSPNITPKPFGRIDISSRDTNVISAPSDNNNSMASPKSAMTASTVTNSQTASPTAEVAAATAISPVPTSSSLKSEATSNNAATKSASFTAALNNAISSSQTSLNVPSNNTVTGSSNRKSKQFARNTIKMEGWLETCDDQTNVWTRNWCALEGGFLWLFNSPAENSRPKGLNKPKTMLNATKTLVRDGVCFENGWKPEDVDSKGPHLISFTIIGKRQMLLAAPSEEEKKSWIEELELMASK